jgi:hypothetical protein
MKAAINLSYILQNAHTHKRFMLHALSHILSDNIVL